MKSAASPTDSNLRPMHARWKTVPFKAANPKLIVDPVSGRLTNVLHSSSPGPISMKSWGSQEERLHAAARDVTEDLSDEEKMRRGMHQSPARTRRQERLFTVRSEAPPWLPKTGVLAPLVRVEEITYSLRQSL
ncbi:uncharacterized protein LOC142814256 isoform X1 [Rhipicephalus microplus]|uniref:uncharacterized protein LOC142814256 isoform X1 n=1 Tax=Rhipicephalus microplus TaxID=6941 RepID=UPI003F6D2075